MADTDVRIEIQADTKQAVDDIGKVKEAVQELPKGLQDAVKATAQSSSAFRKQIQKILSVVQSLRDKIAKPFKMVFDSAPMAKLRSQVQKTTASIQNMNTALRAVTGVAAIGSITAIGSAIAGLGISAVQASADFTKYEVAFSTMLKSTERGKELFQELADFAINTPFDVKGVVGTSQKLMAFGVQAEDLTATMEILGDATAAFGGNSDLLDRMGYALGQMRVSGRLNAQDMNQLANAGIPAWEMLADAAGKSVAEIREMSEKGMIDGVAAADTIMAGLRDRYGGAMEAMNQTVGGLWSSIEESATVALATIGDYLIDTFDIKGLLNTVSTALGNVIESLRKAKEAGKSFSEAIIDAVPKPVLVALGSLVSVIGAGLVGACAAGTIAMWGLIAPVLPIVAAIAGIGVAITALYVYWDDLVNEVTWAWNSIGDIIEDACSAFVLAILSAIGAVVGGVVGAAANIVAVIGEMITLACGYCPQFVADFKDMLAETFNAICDWVNGCLAEIAKVFAAQEAVRENASGGASGGGDDGEKKGTKTVDELIAGFKPLTSGSFGGDGGSYGGGGGGGSRGVDMNAKQQEADMKRVEQEVNRVTEALAKAQTATADLQQGFQDLASDIDFAGKDGAEAVYGAIEKERIQRIQAVEDVLEKQKQAIDEAEALRESARKTGDAKAIADAESLCEERKNLLAKSEEESKALIESIHQQQNNKIFSMDTALAAMQAEAQAAMNAANMEDFMAYLEGENVARLAALEEEQALRQQLYDWRMESEMSLQTFALEAAETLKNQLADGFAELVVAGGSLSDKLKDITKNIVQMFVKYVAQKQIADAYVKLAGNKQNKENIKNNMTEAKSIIPAAVDKCIAMMGPTGSAAYATAHSAGITAGLASLNLEGFAKGGRAKGWAIVGEEGPELVNFTHPGRVYTADETAAAMQGFNPDLLAMASGAMPSTAYISSGAGETVSVSAVQNIYGGINSGMDEEDAFSFFSDAIMQGVRAT